MVIVWGKGLGSRKQGEKSLFINMRKLEKKVSLGAKEFKRKFDLHGNRRLCNPKGGHTLPPVYGVAA